MHVKEALPHFPDAIKEIRVSGAKVERLAMASYDPFDDDDKQKLRDQCERMRHELQMSAYALSAVVAALNSMLATEKVLK